MAIASLQDLFRATWSDAEFKQGFLTDPKATLQQAGVTIPSGAELIVLEESDNNIFLVIPGAEVAAEIEDQGDLIAQLIARAATDDGLRGEMLADPKTVILRETGLVIPEEAHVSVLHQTNDRVYFVLPRPAQSEDTDRELSDAELESVAAGGWFIPVVTFSIKFCAVIYRTIMNGVRGCLG